MQNVKTYMQCWLEYYKNADLKIRLQGIDEWLRRSVTEKDRYKQVSRSALIEKEKK